MLFLCLLTVPGLALACTSPLRRETPSQGLIISGGYPSDSAGQSVEVYVPSTGQHCQLPDLPDYRYWHSQDNRILCGGWSSGTETSCLTLTDAGWERTTTLLELRSYHSSWDSPSGLILLGGDNSPRTSEKINQDGSSYSFDLKHDTNLPCSINLGSSVILTGGRHTTTLTTVSEYNETGWVRDLPDLLQWRSYHGCSQYDNDDGTQTMLVTGGYDGSARLSSTELLVGTASAWVPAGELPSPRQSLRGANIDNRVLMTGGYDGSYLDEILEFDLLTGQWKLVDRMIQAREWHAISTITFDSELCV